MSSIVEDYPLALCDSSTVRPDDVVSSDTISGTYRGESLQPMFRDHYRWYFLRDQTMHEILLMKMYDSSQSVQARCELIGDQVLRSENLN